MNIESTASQLAKEIYTDIAQPAAKQVGLAIETLFKIGLSPVSLLDWGFQNSKEWLENKMRAKLERTPLDCQTTPRPSLAIPLLTNIASSYGEPEMQRLYAELLLKSMDTRTAELVHPAYVSLLSQLSPHEALVLLSLQELSEAKADRAQGESIFMERSGQYTGDSTDTLEMQFASHCASLGYKSGATAQIWLDNLRRLALVESDRVSDTNLITDPWEHTLTKLNQVEYRFLVLTDFGHSFLRACRPEQASED